MTRRQVPADELHDRKSPREVESHTHVWQGRVFGLDEDLVRVVDGQEPVVRQYLAHPGAVGIVALRGEEGAEQVLLERQYRHPVGAELWEVPAGLLDVAGEEPWAAARRELREEADLEAARWDVLVDYFTSPGGSSESIRVYLARDVRPTATPFPREDEEADMLETWVDLDEAVSGVLAGRFHNPTTVVGILATATARSRGWQSLRPLDAPWLR
ncbi:NUDIX domain-containing protein [Actinomyces polynesiensis]|uniref:NUDIX domain-containing protein n=1 Tax=Actinomyces polynesiensis TaxID=1325934 RepID=UPI0005BAC531|nr:NUDIX hydrolase [Actinomyces polynesiensis]